MSSKSTTWKISRVILGCLQNMSMGGIIYGWSSISTLFISKASEGGLALNYDYLHILFVASTFAGSLSPLILGLVLDNYGPRVCSITSIIIIVLGCILLSISSAGPSSWVVSSICMIGFGGPGVQNAVIHLSNLFPIWKSSMTALITGSFQFSFIIFFLFDQMWTQLKFSYRQIFILYALFCLMQVWISVLLWPDIPYEEKEFFPKQHTEQELTDTIDDEHTHLLPAHMNTSSSTITQYNTLNTYDSIKSRLPQLLTKDLSIITTTTTTLNIGGGGGGGRRGQFSSHRTTPLYTPPVHGYHSHHHHHHATDSINTTYDDSRTSISLLVDEEEERDDPDDIQHLSLLQQICSPLYLELLLFSIIFSFWANFYIGTLDIQLGDIYRLSHEERNHYGKLFTMIMSFGAVGIPIIGYVMDTYGFPFTSFLTTICAFIWSLLSYTENKNTLIASFVFYSLYRTFLFSFIFAYLADVMGFKYFGILVGILFAIGGVVGLLQFNIRYYVAGTCHEFSYPQYNSTSNTFENTENSCSKGYWNIINLCMMITFICWLLFSYNDYMRRKIKANTILRSLSATSNMSLSDAKALMKKTDQIYISI